MTLHRHLVVYNWKIFNDRKSLFICVEDGDCWIVKEDITPDGTLYYGGQGDRFIGMRLNKTSPAIKDVSKYDTIEPDPDTDDYLKRIGV